MAMATTNLVALPNQPTQAALRCSREEHPHDFAAPMPAQSRELLASAARSWDEAQSSTTPAARYAHAHLSALRASAAVLAARARPSRGQSRGPRNAWILLAAVAPEFAEWATYFAAGATKRIAAEAGISGVVTPREADDLVRDAAAFLELVRTVLGIDRGQIPLPLAGAG